MARGNRGKGRSRRNNNEGETTRHPNRNADKHESRVDRGNRELIEEQRVSREGYTLDWFKPTVKQKEIVYSICDNDLTLCAASSGCGKTTTAIWQALKEVQSGRYKRILFIKTPNESADDKIGYLPSSAEDKLAVHFEATRGVFQQFMSSAKLAMEEKRGRIMMKIPNFIQGSTFDDTIIIIDESQSISPPIMKLLLERSGVNTKCIVLGDKRQRYSKDKRADGFTDLVNMATDVDEDGRYSKIDTIGYVEMNADDNMRSDLSKLIVSLYEAED